MLTKQQDNFFKFLCQFIENNGFPPTYSEIARALHFSSDGTVRTYLELLERKGYIQRLKHARGIKILKSFRSSIPVLGKIAAGVPIMAVENYLCELDDFDQLKYKEGRFSLRITGDSMIDAGIMDGDYVILEKTSIVNNGEIAAVLIDHDVTLKRVFFKNDTVVLKPENASYDPIVMKPSFFNQAIIGRYIALVRTTV